MREHEANNVKLRGQLVLARGRIATLRQDLRQRDELSRLYDAARGEQSAPGEASLFMAPVRQNPRKKQSGVEWRRIYFLFVVDALADLFHADAPPWPSRRGPDKALSKWLGAVARRQCAPLQPQIEEFAKFRKWAEPWRNPRAETRHPDELRARRVVRLFAEIAPAIDRRFAALKVPTLEAALMQLDRSGPSHGSKARRLHWVAAELSCACNAFGDARRERVAKLYADAVRSHVRGFIDLESRV